MSDGERQESRVEHVFNGEIKHGMGRYYRREYDDGRVEIFYQRRKHSFKNGYRDHGTKLSKTFALTKKDAWAVRDLLNDWLQENEDDE